MSEKLQKLIAKPVIQLIPIIVVGLLIFSNTLNVPFHFDDKKYIIGNHIIKDLAHFAEPHKTVRHEVPDQAIINFFKTRFVAFFSFAINHEIHGLNVTGYHIFNISIHILNAMLIYWFVMLTLSYQQSVVSNQHKPDSPIHPFTYLPFFSALLFVAHPIQTQAVTYIWQRVTSLAVFFYLLSIVMYIKFRMQQSAFSYQLSAVDGQGFQIFKLNAKSYLLYASSLFSAILAMFTKEIAFTLPVIIALYEFMFLEGKIRKRIHCLIPFLLTLLIIPLMRLGVDHSHEINAIREFSTLSRLDYLFTQFRVITTYVRLLYFPINQNLDYDYPIYDSFFTPEVFLSSLFLLALFGHGVYLFKVSIREQRERTYTALPFTPSYIHRLIAFGIFWFFITVSVESSFIPIADVIFEHRVHLPSVGAFISITSFFIIPINKLILKRKIIYRTAFLCLTAAIIIFAIASHTRNNDWRNEISLWKDAIETSPGKARAQFSLGSAYHSSGLLDKAIEHYEIARRLEPDYAGVYNNLGMTYINKGLTDIAIEHFKIALKLDPCYPEAYNNLGNAYCSQNLTDQAIEYYRTALRFKPDYVDAHYNLSMAYYKNGIKDKAQEHYRQANIINSQ